MKTVRLPLYEDGLELMEYLEINVEHFLGAAGDAAAHRYMRVVQMPTPEQEKEMIDRIISGLPTRPFPEDSNDWIGDALAGRHNPWREYNKREHIGEFAKPEEPEEEWKTIQGLDSGNFEISNFGHVRNRVTKRKLPAHDDFERGNYYRLVINRVPVTLYSDILVKEYFN